MNSFSLETTGNPRASRYPSTVAWTAGGPATERLKQARRELANSSTFSPTVDLDSDPASTPSTLAAALSKAYVRLSYLRWP